MGRQWTLRYLGLTCIDKGMLKWVASSVGEKKAFMMCLYKLVHKPPGEEESRVCECGQGETLGDKERLTQVGTVADLGFHKGGS